MRKMVDILQEKDQEQIVKDLEHLNDNEESSDSLNVVLKENNILQNVEVVFEGANSILIGKHSKCCVI